MSRFGKTIKLLRESHGFTLREVERRTGISNALLCQMESGKIVSPSALNVMKLARLFGLHGMAVLWNLMEAIEEDSGEPLVQSGGDAIVSQLATHMRRRSNKPNCVACGSEAYGHRCSASLHLDET